MRIQLAREFHRAQHACVEGHAAAAEFVFQKAIIKARVVRDEEFAFQPLQQIAVDIRERRRACHHRVVNARQRLDCRRYAHVRVYQRRPLAHQPTVMNLDHAHFGDAIMRGGGTSGFQINKDGVFVQHG